MSEEDYYIFWLNTLPFLFISSFFGEKLKKSDKGQVIKLHFLVGNSQNSDE